MGHNSIMSRITKYQESITKFIKSTSCLSSIESESLKDMVDKLTEETDKYGSILLLTVINNQNKKNKVGVQGYYAASAVEFLACMVRIKTYLPMYQKEYPTIGTDAYPVLYSAVLKSVMSNAEITNRYVKDVHKYQKIYANCVSVVANDFPSLSDHDDPTKTPKKTDNIFRFYLNQRADLNDKYLDLKLYDRTVLMNRYRKSYCKVFQMAVSLGWLLTGSPEKELPEMNKIGVMFGFVYKIGSDFERIDDDLEHAVESTDNYLVNCGLQKAYDDYMQFKQNLITLLMTHDLYTRTTKEMLEELDERVDKFIENSHPDVKSSFSEAQLA